MNQSHVIGVISDTHGALLIIKTKPILVPLVNRAHNATRNDHPKKIVYTEQIIAAVAKQTSDFRMADIQRECPGASVDMIRKVLIGLRPGVKYLRRGPNALYQKTEKWNSVISE
jgi:hypothetical protein